MRVLPSLPPPSHASLLLPFQIALLFSLFCPTTKFSSTRCPHQTIVKRRSIPIEIVFFPLSSLPCQRLLRTPRPARAPTSTRRSSASWGDSHLCSSSCASSCSSSPSRFNAFFVSSLSFVAKKSPTEWVDYLGKRGVEAGESGNFLAAGRTWLSEGLYKSRKEGGKEKLASILFTFTRGLSETE